MCQNPNPLTKLAAGSTDS